MRGSRLKFWKTKPILRLRTRARSSADSRDTSSPSSQYSPEVGRSRQPRMFISVLLPEPGRAHQGDQLAAGDRQRDALEHGHVDLAEVVGLVDVAQLDEFHVALPGAGRRRRPPPPRRGNWARRGCWCRSAAPPGRLQTGHHRQPFG